MLSTSELWNPWTPWSRYRSEVVKCISSSDVRYLFLPRASHHIRQCVCTQRAMLGCSHHSLSRRFYRMVAVHKKAAAAFLPLRLLFCTAAV